MESMALESKARRHLPSLSLGPQSIQCPLKLQYFVARTPSEFQLSFFKIQQTFNVQIKHICLACNFNPYVYY